MTYPSEIRFGDCIETMKAWLAEGKAGTVQTCVTSPPYFGLRDYGVEGQFGLEKTPDEYVKKMVEVFRLVRELLADDGTVWLNLGDSYAGSWGNYGGQNRGNGRQREITVGSSAVSKAYEGKEKWRPPTSNKIEGIKEKDLMGIPWRVAFALQAEGWWLRQDIIWRKPNPMPESVLDRCTRSHEYIFLLSKSQQYYFDSTAIKEPCVRPDEGKRKTPAKFGGADKYVDAGKQSRLHSGNEYLGTKDGKRNRRSVWTVSTKPYKGAHFATFPTELIEPCILAGSSERGHCPLCRSCWAREIVKTDQIDLSAKGSRFDIGKTGSRMGGDRTQAGERYISESTGRWLPTCSCGVDPVSDVVLDPFIGSGTTAQVALKHGRRYLGCELNPEYKALIDKRIAEMK